MDREGVIYLLSSLISFLLISFQIIYRVFDLDRIVHVFLRLYLPETVHPKLSDVLPKSAKVHDYPLVAVQLPMLNEIECCETVIACACSLKWPKSRLIVQVLDDSTDDVAKMLVDKSVEKWSKRGIQIQLHRREVRSGYKAGSLISGMKVIPDAEYIALFDADFLPSADFLHKTIPTLMKDPQVAFVQARWTFTNPKESFLTRMQEITLNFHHKCEQTSRYKSSLYFTFNGTGGVLRRTAIEDIGGWHTDTLVEDLDLSIRAYIQGWQSVYMHNLGCLNELPPTQAGYLSQQYRWTSGPMQVAQKIVPDIVRSKRICWYQKLYCVWYLFRSWAYLTTLFSLVVIMPLSIWIYDTDQYNIISISLSIILGFAQMAFTRDEMHLFLPYIFFMNGMSLNNGFATIAGIFNYGQAKKWIVTPKFGTSSVVTSSDKLEQQTTTGKEYPYYLRLPLLLIDNVRRRIHRHIEKRNDKIVRFYGRYLVFAIYLFCVASFAFKIAKYWSAWYLTFTSIVYFLMAFGCMGRPEN